MDPVSAGLAGVSLISGKNAQKKAQSSADKARKSNQRIEDRAVQLWDVLFKRAEDAVKGGTFDPEKRIAALEKQTGDYESRDLGNLSGALTTAGYKAGDSEIGTRLDSVKLKYRKFLDNMRDQIRTQSFWDEQNAFASANPAYLQGAMQNSGQRAMTAQASVPNSGDFLSTLMPFLKPQTKKPSFSGGGSNTSSSGWLPAVG